ncbi:conserved hypothetical protein (plasmid) [Borreliella afzelii PKo]|uniref:Uncharacterized protein n=1 Tax=Borreliella afzelii (strain PKo) TaxID=390236 RepID=Q0SLQ5_BORAP|nr:hypothetical protein BAPKO_2526 [Borreliella afzelii PKo]ACJ73663.1 conserved hypothetical protein [Borreliella afzelii ACA-1]AEL70476.1 conserved hypothetical protein [Borreliella afzelii PKo]
MSNLYRRVLKLEVETKNLVALVNEVKSKLGRVEIRLNKVDDGLNKSNDKCMFFTNKLSKCT